MCTGQGALENLLLVKPDRSVTARMTYLTAVRGDEFDKLRSPVCFGGDTSTIYVL